MSNQHGFPPPPPPPSEPSPGTPAASYFSQLRRRTAAAQPPSITTNFHRTYAPSVNSPQAQTAFPYSPSTPIAPNPRTPNAGRLYPGSAGNSTSPTPLASAGGNMAQPYNPRQWSGHGAYPSRSQHTSPLARDTREATGMELAMPSPPPPYSPETPNSTLSPRAVRPSPMLEQASFVSSPLASESFGTTLPIASSLRQSPQALMSPAFPPPPGQSTRHRERSASGQRLFNTIQSLTSRGKQPVSNEVSAGYNMSYPQNGDVDRPPASRRAASTGHMFPSSASPPAMRPTAGPSTGRSSPEASWQPGMPLPGPPPGPPPPGTRSQSLNRYPATPSRSNSAGSDGGARPIQRRAAQASTLGPVPPTPADWIENDNTASDEHLVQSHEPAMQPLRIDTGAHRENSLSRRPAQRDASAQGIRERRSRSRAAREPNSNIMLSPISDVSRPGDLLLSTVEGSISQRREHLRKISGYANVSAYTNTLPQERSEAEIGHEIRRDPPAQVLGNVLTPPYTPAVGGHTAMHSNRAAPGSASSDRPISHLLHAPNDDVPSMPAPLSPARPSSSTSAQASHNFESFHLQALERHRAFIDREVLAVSDEERLELFANYLVHESRLRRDRYSAAYNTMAGDIVDMTRDMWRSYTQTGKRVITPSTSISSLDHTIPSSWSDGRPSSRHANMPSSASSTGDFTPGTDASSLGDAGDLIDRAERQWGEQFKPSLSPIPSMAVSTVPDEDDSRGRAPSRWWDKSDSGSVGKPDRIVKTSRETKYMGVTPATLQDDPRHSPELMRSTPTPGTSSFALAHDEYPAEKIGWHEDNDFNTPMATPARPGSARNVQTLSAEQLDISRLVTLPPPYPRHHPAVNNSHPLLSELRNIHRKLADREEIQKIQDGYLDKDWALQRSQQEETKQRRNRLRTSVQGKVSSGQISFAEAAQTEADFDAGEAERGKASARVAFDTFEAAVSHPLNILLTARLEIANTCITSLRSELESDASASNLDQTQEEGDDHPERLEKLTLLKWLFEARELLHKEMFDLHAQRGEKYAEVILTPYRLAHQQAKLDEAEAFFAKDGRERQIAFARDAAKRFAELEGIVDRNVKRGVEDQLSAFWDIAPGLLETVQMVPCDEDGLARVEVLIPAAEFEENPALRDWPLQYLYSLLSHAEKSAYQFIESQINLLCLLHEVRGAAAKVQDKVIEVEITEAGARRVQMLEVRREEEDRLDVDLKEKVGEVERQWREALGEGLGECKSAVKAWLEVRGGWVEEL